VEEKDLGEAALALVLLLCAAFPAAAADKIPWIRDEARATADAGERRGPVMILFTSTNCGGRAVAGDAARAAAGGGVVGVKQDFQDRCELLEEDVLSRPDVLLAVARFVPLLSDEGLLPGAKIDPQGRSLNRRYQVGTIPTVLFADPWGNEIIRLVGRIPKDAFLRVANAIPADFAPIEKAGRLLRDEAQNASALVANAAFYQERGLLPVSERLYEQALGTSALQADAATRRQVVIARGLNLMRMGKPRDAARLFEKTLAKAPDGPASDALLFGWLTAESQDGRAKQAREIYGRLAQRFPDSPYAARAKQNLEAAP